MLLNIILMVPLHPYTEYLHETTTFLGFQIKISILEAYFDPNYHRNCHTQLVQPQFLHILHYSFNVDSCYSDRVPFTLSFKPKKSKIEQWELCLTWNSREKFRQIDNFSKITIK